MSIPIFVKTDDRDPFVMQKCDFGSTPATTVHRDPSVLIVGNAQKLEKQKKKDWITIDTISCGKCPKKLEKTGSQ